MKNFKTAYQLSASHKHYLPAGISRGVDLYEIESTYQVSSDDVKLELDLSRYGAVSIRSAASRSDVNGFAVRCDRLDAREVASAVRRILAEVLRSSDPGECWTDLLAFCATEIAPEIQRRTTPATV